MASPFYPISSTRPSLTPPTIGGFSSSPPAGTPLTHAFSQQPLNNQQHTSMLAPSASIGSSGSLLMPSMLRPTMPPQATEIPETTSAGSFAPAVSAPAAAPSTPASSAVDETQVMTKLQQLMNQMGTFMKSVDARLTTLEKMTGQLMSSHTEQAKSMELRFQEIAQLIQQKSSIIQLQPQGGSHPTQAQPHSSFSGVPAVPVSHQSFSAPAQAVPGGAAASADYELARQLQEQFDRESHQQVPRPGQPLYAPMGSAPMGTAPIVPGMGVPTQPNLAALQMQQFQQQQQQQQRQAMPPAGKVDPKQLSTCPICSVQKPLADMEEHVNQHFDESEGVVVEALDQSKAKQQNRGFWDRLFGAEDEPQPPAPGPPAGQTGAGPFPPGGQMLMYPTGGMHPGAAGQPMYGYAAYPQPQQYSYRR